LISLGNLGGLWWVAIGWFLYQAAMATVLQDRAVEVASGVTVAAIMQPTPRSAPGEMTVAEFADAFAVGERFTAVPVVVAGRVRGLMGPSEVLGAPSGATHLVEVMERLSPQAVVEAGATVSGLFGLLDGPESRVVVVDAGRVVGVVTSTDLARFLDRVV
jgi:CBS domain-containing protein